MRMPSTSAAQTFFMDPARKYVQFNQFAYPALQVLSVAERANQGAIIQSTGSYQPVWSSISGPFSFVNNPGTLSGLPPGIAALLFSGTQYMEYDALASVYAAPEAALTVTCVMSSSAAGGTIWSFADASDGYSLSLSYGSGTLSLTETNTHGTFTASATVTHDTVHVVTATRAGGVLTLRIDGAAVSGPISVTAGTVALTTFVLGALNSGGSISSQYHGSLAKLAVYSGAADILSVETFLLQNAGIILGPSQGINSGF